MPGAIGAENRAALKNRKGAQTCVLDVGDFMRIRACAKKTGLDGPKSSWAAEKEQLHQKSQARAATWGNTIAAQRKKKEEAKTKRLDREEEARKVIDRDEAQIQATKRRDAIERAQRMLYEDSDRVKTFASGMLLSDVLEEREAQIHLKHTKLQIEAAEEEEWYQLQQEQLAAHDMRETKQEAAARKKVMEAQRMRFAQLEQVKGSIVRRREKEQMEGQAIIARAHEEAERQKLEINAKREAARQSQEETQQMNDMLQERRDRERHVLELEERKIEQYAKAKEALATERAQRADEKFREELAVRQQMIDRANEHLAALNQNEETVLLKQIEEREKSDAEREAAKASFRAREMEACDISRRAQMRIRDNAKTRAKDEDTVLSEQWSQSCARLKAEEMAEVRDGKDYAKAIQQFQLRQVAEKQRRKGKGAQRDDVDAIRDIVRGNEIDAQFEMYSGACMDEYAQAGKDLQPLQLALRRATQPNTDSHAIK